MVTRDQDHYVGSQHSRSPVAQGALLLGIYIALHLGVAGFIHVVNALDAPSASASALPASTQEMPAGDSRDPVSERSGSARE